MKMRSSAGLIALFFLTLPAILFFSCSRGNKTTDSEIVFSAKLIKPVDAVDLEKRLKAELVRRYERMYAACMLLRLHDGRAGGRGGDPGGIIPGGWRFHSTGSGAILKVVRFGSRLFRNQ
jgi:hypothetical protein